MESEKMSLFEQLNSLSHIRSTTMTVLGIVVIFPVKR